MRQDRQRIGQAVSNLARSVTYYEKLDVDVSMLVAAWQELEAADRVRIGEVAPLLVDGLIRVEDRLSQFADVT